MKLTESIAKIKTTGYIRSDNFKGWKDYRVREGIDLIKLSITHPKNNKRIIIL